jgi:hypothetical protein
MAQDGIKMARRWIMMAIHVPPGCQQSTSRVPTGGQRVPAECQSPGSSLQSPDASRQQPAANCFYTARLAGGVLKTMKNVKLSSFLGSWGPRTSKSSNAQVPTSVRTLAQRSQREVAMCRSYNV